MSIKLSDSIRVGQQKPLEDKYFNELVPYTSTTQVNTLLPKAVRHIGLTVNVNKEEYWYKDGIEDSNLVLKITNSDIYDLKNQEQDNRLENLEGENVAQYDLIHDLRSDLESERTRNEAQDSMLYNLEGINYVWSPTNRTLTLFDRGGTQLSQVSLVSLDDEGTNLRYNDTTLSLELYNANNELLDSIPVSSFIGSVGTQLQLNSNQLQLRDSQGNILSTVTFAVSNIDGLQTVLNSKLDKGGYEGTAQTLKNDINNLKRENIAQAELISGLRGELDFEKGRNDAQDSRLENYYLKSEIDTFNNNNYVYINQTIFDYDAQIQRQFLDYYDKIAIDALLYSSYYTKSETYNQTEINGFLSGKQNTIGYTPENVSNKSDSYTASSSTTYASSKALVDGLSTKADLVGGKIPASQLPAYVIGNPHNTTATDVDALKRDGSNANSAVNIGAYYFESSQGFKKTGGTANQFLMADGNTNTYGTTSGTVAEGNHTHTFASITSKPTTLSGYGIVDAINTSDVVTTATANKILKLDANAKLPTSITGNADGNATTATKLQTPRKINGVSFDGSADITINAGTTYTLPIASATVLGGVKIGSGISIDGNGVISANAYTAGTNISISGNQISVVSAPTFAGSVTATAFYESSLRELKENILPFELSGLGLLSQLDIVTYDRKDGSVKDKIGIIADDSPEEFLSENKDAVDLYKTVFIQAKAIQELNAKNLELEERLIKLEKLLSNG